MSARKFLFCFVSFWIIFGLILGFYYYQFASVPLERPAQTEPYLFASGEKSTQLAKDLAQQGLIRHAWFFRFMMILQWKIHRLQAGEYIFPANSTEQQILNQLVQGKVVMHRITFVEGWNLRQILQAMQAEPSLVHTLSIDQLQAISRSLGIEQANPEGWFFPDTYQFSYGTTDLDLLRKAYQRMQTLLTQIWTERDPSVNYTHPYEALIVASLIEKEAKVKSEQPKIAAVILLRLKKGMRLQIDPTVSYALAPHDNQKLSKHDLAINSPYNTYRFAGLPPTPIASPGLGALLAALHPLAGSNALYFVARGDGTHEFSATLSAQNAAVRHYLS